MATVNKELCKGIPVESRAWPLAIVALVCIPVSLIAVALRCYSRLAISRQIGYDDFIIIVAAVFLIALGVLDLYSTSLYRSRQEKANHSQMDSSMATDSTPGLWTLSNSQNF